MKPQRVVAIVACVVLAFGVFLRFYRVDHKVFWDDEVIASLHIMGQSERDIVAHAGTFRSIADLRAVLHPVGNGRPLAATIETLQTEDPQHPPLYYLIARLWVASFGDSLTALRTLSAVIGAVALPCVFWLGYELFGTALAALALTAFIAVSPVDLVYAQQIREYGLWLVAMLVTSALFVRALRSGSLTVWLAYAIALSASLYVFPGSLLIAGALAIVAALSPTTIRNRAYALAAIVVGCALYTPWLVVMATHVNQIDRGMATIDHARTSPLSIARTFIELIRLDSFDLNGKPKWFAAAMTLPVVGMIGYAVYALRRSPSAVRRWYVWSLIVCSSLPLVLADLLTGGQRTASTRYFIPLFLAVDIALVDVLVRQVLTAAASSAARRAWIVAFTLLLGVRIGSCVAASRAQTWWSDYNNQSISVAASVSDAPHAVLMGDDYIVWALSLSEYADPHVRVALNPRCYLCALPEARKPDLSVLVRPNDLGSVFLLGPSKSLQHAVLALLRTQPKAPAYACIDIRDNCSSELDLF